MAQTTTTEPPVDSTEYPTLHFYTLQNGLQLVVARDPGVPLATALLAVRGGRASQVKPFNGIPVLLHALLLDPNPELAAGRTLLNQSRNSGLQFGGTLGGEYMQFNTTIPKGRLAQAIARLASALRNPQFGEVEIKKKADELAAKAAVQELKPTVFLQEEMLQRLWAPHPESKSAQLDYAGARAASPTYLKVYVERFFKANNAVLIVGGDVDTTQCLALADSLFRDWPTDNEPLPPPADYLPLEQDTAWLATNERATAPFVQVGWQLPGTDEQPSIRARGRMLGLLLDTPGNRLENRLVQRGFALQVAARFEPGRNKSQLALTIVPNPFYLRQCLDSLRKEINQLGDAHYFTARDLTNALQLLEAERVYERENNAGLCRTLADWWALNGLNSYAGFVDSLKQTTERDIAAWATQYLGQASHSAGILTSSEMATGLRLEQYVRDWNNPRPPVVVNATAMTPADSLKLAAMGTEPTLLEDSEEYFGNLLYQPDKQLGRFTVFFRLGKQEIDSASIAKLHVLADYLKRNPTVKIFADGHTDRSGSSAFNYKLSLNRAARVRNVLVRQLGVEPGRINIRGFGEKKLLYDDPDPNIDALNRRVEFARDEK